MSKRITKKDKKEWIINNTDGGCITWDGCDEAIIGIVERYKAKPVLAYDYQRLVKVFMDNDMTYDEACEWIDINIHSQYVNEETPVLINVCPWLSV